MLKSVFFGNSEFCIPSLKVLHEKTELKLIFTGPDKYVGRGMKNIKIPEPKEFAILNKIDYLQTYDYFNSEIVNKLKEIAPDIMIVVSYGRIIPKNVFELSKIGTFNIHASILPKYRGASPIQESLINGDRETGVTIQKINEKLDEGNIVFLKKIDILPEDNYISLSKKLAALSAEALSSFIDLAEKGEVKEYPQVGVPSYCRKIKKEDGLINWEKDTTDLIINKWKAFILWPKIYTFYKGIRITLTHISKFEGQIIENRPGSVNVINKILVVKTIDGAISVERIKPENSREMSSAEFINGYKIKNKEVFG